MEAAVSGSSLADVRGQLLTTEQFTVSEVPLKDVGVEIKDTTDGVKAAFTIEGVDVPLSEHALINFAQRWVYQPPMYGSARRPCKLRISFTGSTS